MEKLPIDLQLNYWKNRTLSLEQQLEKTKIKAFTGIITSIAISVCAAYLIMHMNRAQQKTDHTLWTIYPPDQIEESFVSVAGAHEAKEALSEIVNFLKDPEAHSRLGAKIPCGVLLTGEPGTGKTLLARAIAGEAGCTFISVTGSAFVQMYVGLGAARLRAMFEDATQYAPCIIFIDEIDAIGSKRQIDQSAGAQEHSHALNQLLACMDGFESKNAKNPIIVIGATNNEKILDKALLRPGRFDRVVQVPLPCCNDRADILEIYIAKIIYANDIDLNLLAQRTSGFSGAELEQLVNQAALIATKNNQNDVTMANFDEAINIIKMGTPAPYIKMGEQEKKTTAYHEAGHALAFILQPEITGQLHSVTIVPRSRALGVTSWFPEEDKHSWNKEEMLSQITIALAGRGAEELMFGEIGTGAHNDFQKASDIARNMICQYGMTEMGVCTYDHYEISDNTRHQIDAAVKKILDQQYLRMMTLLKTNKSMLIKLAEALLKKETLSAEEIYKLLNIKK